MALGNRQALALGLLRPMLPLVFKDLVEEGGYKIASKLAPALIDETPDVGPLRAELADFFDELARHIRAAPAIDQEDLEAVGL